MADTAQIANLAAARIGTASRITSLDDDRTLARAMKAVWDIERQAAIRDGSWNFATRREQLSATNTYEGVLLPWSYAYALPALCLRVLEVADADNQFAIEQGKVLCNLAAPITVKFLVDVPEPSSWDTLAAEAFALRLAWRIGRQIAGEAFDSRAAWTEYREAISQAKHVDASEGPGIEQAESGWIEARQGWR